MSTGLTNANNRWHKRVLNGLTNSVDWSGQFLQLEMSRSSKLRNGPVNLIGDASKLGNHVIGLHELGIFEGYCEMEKFVLECRVHLSIKITSHKMPVISA